ncbi:MAG: hypothetical protein LBT22_02865 [Peptococcaceae bacterium]|nr:hypothetical protein [Peptococcaceae bacterium]
MNIILAGTAPKSTPMKSLLGSAKGGQVRLLLLRAAKGGRFQDYVRKRCENR